MKIKSNKIGHERLLERKGMVGSMEGVASVQGMTRKFNLWQKGSSQEGHEKPSYVDERGVFTQCWTSKILHLINICNAHRVWRMGCCAYVLDMQFVPPKSTTRRTQAGGPKQGVFLNVRSEGGKRRKRVRREILSKCRRPPWGRSIHSARPLVPLRGKYVWYNKGLISTQKLARFEFLPSGLI